MLKKSTWLAVAIVLFTLVMFVSSVTALEMNEDSRTVLKNQEGETIVLGLEQYVHGKELFSYACASCHGQGMTKTNPNIGMDLKSLSRAYPPRDNLEGLVGFLKNPKTYDGEINMSLFHPSIESADIYPTMRNLTEDDLVALAGFVLIEPQVNDRWAAGKYSR